MCGAAVHFVEDDRDQDVDDEPGSSDDPELDEFAQDLRPISLLVGGHHGRNPTAMGRIRHITLVSSPRRSSRCGQSSSSSGSIQSSKLVCRQRNRDHVHRLGSTPWMTSTTSLECRNVTASLGFSDPCLDLLLDGRVLVHTTMMDMHRSAACAVSAAVGTPDTGGWTGS